jgi:hypothetical protein
MLHIYAALAELCGAGPLRRRMHLRHRGRSLSTGLSTVDRLKQRRLAAIEIDSDPRDVTPTPPGRGKILGEVILTGGQAIRHLRQVGLIWVKRKEEFAQPH